MLIVATILGIVGGILGGALLTLLGQWWLSNRQTGPSRLLCEVAILECNDLVETGVSSVRADLFLGDDAPYVFGNLRLHNRGPRRVNDITVALGLDTIHVAAYRCLPPSSPTFAVGAEVAEGKIILRVPYLNVGGGATLSFVARGWLMSPTVRVDAVDVKVVKMISPGALDLSRLRLSKPSKLHGDYFEQFTGRDS